MAEMVRSVFSGGAASSVISAVGLVFLLVAIARVSWILASATVRACRAWALAARYTRRAAESRRRLLAGSAAPRSDPARTGEHGTGSGSERVAERDPER